MTSPLWTKRQVAEYLAVSRSTVDRIVRRGDLPFSRINGRKRFRESDVLFYVASRRFNHQPVTSSPANAI